MIGRILYWMMVVGYLGCSMYAPSIKMKIVGFLLTIVNAMLFW